MRIANTLEGAVAPYKRLCQRYPDATGEDYIPSALREPGNRCARLRASVQYAARRDRIEDGYRSSNPADDLQPTPHRDLHEDHPLAGQSEHLQLGEERQHQRQLDRTLLRTQLAALARAGEESAEFWGGLGREFHRSNSFAHCSLPRRMASPLRESDWKLTELNYCVSFSFQWMRSKYPPSRTAHSLKRNRQCIELGPAVGALFGDERPPRYSNAHGFMGFFHVLDASSHIFFIHGCLRLT